MTADVQSDPAVRELVRAEGLEPHGDEAQLRGLAEPVRRFRREAAELAHA